MAAGRLMPLGTSCACCCCRLRATAITSSAISSCRPPAGAGGGGGGGGRRARVVRSRRDSAKGVCVCVRRAAMLAHHNHHARTRTRRPAPRSLLPARPRGTRPHLHPPGHTCSAPPRAAAPRTRGCTCAAPRARPCSRWPGRAQTRPRRAAAAACGAGGAGTCGPGPCPGARLRGVPCVCLGAWAGVCARHGCAQDMSGQRCCATTQQRQRLQRASESPHTLHAPSMSPGRSASTGAACWPPPPPLLLRLPPPLLLPSQALPAAMTPRFGMSVVKG
jgi:hypothetical protein